MRRDSRAMLLRTVAVGALLATLPNASVFGSAHTFPTGTVKIPIRYARAVDVSEMLGGGVIPVGPGRMQNASAAMSIVAPWPFGSGSAANLLPDGIQSVMALETDNTLIVRYDTDDALRELKGVIALVDVPVRTLTVRAIAHLTITDSRGRTRVLPFSAEGVAVDQRPVHLRINLEPAGVRMAGADLQSVTSDADLLAQVTLDGHVDLTSDWYVDLVWRAPGVANPMRLKNVFRTTTMLQTGKQVTVTRAGLPLPKGRSDLKLDVMAVQLSPRPAAALSESPDSPPARR